MARRSLSAEETGRARFGRWRTARFFTSCQDTRALVLALPSIRMNRSVSDVRLALARHLTELVRFSLAITAVLSGSTDQSLLLGEIDI